MPALVADAARHIDLPDGARAQQVHGALLMGDGAALHPDLHHAVVFARRHHGAAFKKVVAGRMHPAAPCPAVFRRSAPRASVCA